jgi:hypothetical protein
MNILQTVYFWFLQHCKTTDQTHEGEANLPMDSTNGGLSNTKEGPLCYPYSCLLAAKRDVSNVWIGGEFSQIQNRQEHVTAY